MTKRFVVVSESWTRPEEIWDYYERSIEALVALGAALMSGSVSTTSRFLGKTQAEAGESLAAMRAELDRQVSFTLLAAFEATLRTDFWDRVHRRAKNGPGREFGALAKKCRERVRLEDILDVWNKHSIPHGKAGPLKELARLRDWLAHGRYWVPKSRHKADPDGVWREAERVFAALPGIVPLPQR